FSPAVSRDGQTVAFTQTGPGPLALISIHGGSQTVVNGSLPGDNDPSFTPDGSTLAFKDEPAANLFTISATGAGGRTAVFGAPSGISEPHLSPDGNTIAFVGPIGGPPFSAPIFTIPRSGGAMNQVTTA